MVQELCTAIDTAKSQVGKSAHHDGAVPSLPVYIIASIVDDK
jgi:hypothetical protein